MHYGLVFVGVSIAFGETPRKLFFCMNDFHIIIWPSLRALFSGEFQFPGPDRYEAVRAGPR